MSGYATEVLTGASEIVRAQALLRALATECGQEEALADIHYYLDKPGLLGRTPVLLLIRREGASQDNLAAAVLLFEYKIAGIPLGMYTSNDRSGRRTVVAPVGDRLDMAVQGTEHLLRSGANVVLMSMRSAAMPDAMCDLLTRKTPDVSWIFRQRETADYLQLRATFDDTLAQIGKRTRTHMRYYRRRAEGELGCTFDPQLEIDEQELISFNRHCMYSVPQRVVAWRLRSLLNFESPILMGLRDSDGQLLGVLAGRRLGRDSDVLWQMNRGGLDRHSLSLVMRTYFIEHEIGRGTQRVYLDGGSSHSLSHAFARGIVTDFAAFRHTPLSYLVRKIGKPLIPPDNELAHLLGKQPKSPAREPFLRTE